VVLAMSDHAVTVQNHGLGATDRQQAAGGYGLYIGAGRRQMAGAYCTK
jgi:hypothetical protein